MKQNHILPSKTLKYIAISFILLYIPLFIFFLYAALFYSLTLFEFFHMGLFLGYSLMLMVYLPCLSIPISMYYFWKKYSSAEYTKAWTYYLTPMILFIFIVLLTAAVEEIDDYALSSGWVQP